MRAAQRAPAPQAYVHVGTAGTIGRRGRPRGRVRGRVWVRAWVRVWVRAWVRVWVRAGVRVRVGGRVRTSFHRAMHSRQPMSFITPSVRSHSRPAASCRYWVVAPCAWVGFGSGLRLGLGVRVEVRRRGGGRGREGEKVGGGLGVEPGCGAPPQRMPSRRCSGRVVAAPLGTRGSGRAP